MADLRVPMDPMLTAFGVPAVITRPAPDDTPIATTGFWISALNEPQPVGTDFRRREPRRLFVVARTSVTNAPKGTTVAAVELSGGAVKNWVVDGYEIVDADHLRLILIAAAA